MHRSEPWRSGITRSLPLFTAESRRSIVVDTLPAGSMSMSHGSQFRQRAALL
jgi:hypothetical protein